MLPIPVYAILGYLASGFAILAACEAGYDGNWLLDREWSPGTISLCGVMAYCLGRMVAAVSRFVIEHKFVRGCLSAPEDTLLARESIASRNWKQALFANYYKPLPENIRGQILRGAGQDALDESGRALFRHALAVVDEDRATQNRLNTFLHMSGICRTMCLGLLVVAGILISGIVWHSLSSGWSQAEWRKLGYCLLSLIEAGGMLYRYLKYLRQHAMEVFIAYADVNPP